MKKYYEILEVNEKASQEIIEKAYKTLVKKYHPDLYSTVQKKEAELKLVVCNGLLFFEIADKSKGLISNIFFPPFSF